MQGGLTKYSVVSQVSTHRDCALEKPCFLLGTKIRSTHRKSFLTTEDTNSLPCISINYQQIKDAYSLWTKIF